MTVRAGAYAEYDGRTYACLSVGQAQVVLVVPPGRLVPDGFEHRPDGCWHRVVDKADVSRLFFVDTQASWQGHEVYVQDDFGTRMQIWSDTYPPPSRPEVQIDRDSWSAMVPVSELRDVVETVSEIPL